MTEQLQAPNTLGNLADLIGKLAPIFVGSGPTTETKTGGTSATTTSGSTGGNLGQNVVTGADPEAITLQKQLIASLMPQGGGLSGDESAVVDNIIHRAAIGFAPVLGEANAAGLYKSTVTQQLGSEMAARAVGEASQAVLAHRTASAQIANAGTGNLLQATRTQGTTQQQGATEQKQAVTQPNITPAVTTTTKGPAIAPSTTAALAGILGIGSSALSLFRNRKDIADLLGFGDDAAENAVSGSGTPVDVSGTGEQVGNSVGSTGGTETFGNPVGEQLGTNIANEGAFGPAEVSVAPLEAAPSVAPVAAAETSSAASFAAPAVEGIEFATGGAGGDAIGAASVGGEQAAAGSAAEAVPAEFTTSYIDAGGLSHNLSQSELVNLGANGNPEAVTGFSKDGLGNIIGYDSSGEAVAALPANQAGYFDYATSEGSASLADVFSSGGDAFLSQAGVDIGSFGGAEAAGGFAAEGAFGGAVAGEAAAGAAGAEAAVGAEIAGEVAASEGGAEVAAIAIALWIVCTELVRQKRMPRSWWLAGSKKFASYPEVGKNGYYLWAIPAVRHLRRFPHSYLSKFMEVIFRARAENIAARAGVKSATWRRVNVLASCGVWSFSALLAVPALFMKKPDLIALTKELQDA